MGIEEAIHNQLQSTTALTDLVGDRIFEGLGEQGIETPYLVYLKVAGLRHYDVQLNAPRFQFAGWDADKRVSQEIAEVLVDTFNGYYGDLGGVLAVSSVNYETDIPLFDEEARLWQVVTDFSFVYKEAS